MASDPLLRVGDLRFAYGDAGFALDVPSLELARGERVACIGPSGTGKTTLVHLIAGILVAETGRVEFDGVALDTLDEGRRRELRLARIGMVFQEFELLDYLSALDNVLLPFRLGTALPSPSSQRGRARELAGAMRVEHTLARPPRRLSQGERQRIAICRALVTDPTLVLCDEPTGNLDPESSGRTIDLLFEQVEERGATLLCVTHDHSLLARFDRVIDICELNVRHLDPVVGAAPVEPGSDA